MLRLHHPPKAKSLLEFYLFRFLLSFFEEHLEWYFSSLMEEPSAKVSKVWLLRLVILLKFISLSEPILLQSQN